jgi:hypothetical protein
MPSNFHFLLLIVVLQLLSVPSHAQNFGKIFSTSEERRSLDLLREAMLAELTDAERQAALNKPLLVFSEPVSGIAPAMIHMGGVVRRSDGSHTVWLNGVPVNEQELPANVQLEMLSGFGVLRVRTPTDIFSLRTGQTLNAATGELRESYEVTPEQIAAINAEIARRNEEVSTPDAKASLVEPEDGTAEQDESVLSDEDQSTMDTVLDTLRMLQEARALQESLQ